MATPLNTKDLILQGSDRQYSNLLLVEEKPSVISLYNEILAAQVVLDSSADKYNIVDEKEDYDNSITELINYLNSLITPVAWNDLSNVTKIDRDTFNEKFNNVIVTRTALQLLTTDQFGRTNAIIYAYQRATSLPTLLPGDITYSFVSASIISPAGNNLANGWRKTIPSGGDPLYVSVCTASNFGDTDTIANNEWSSPQLFSGSGINTATVFIYKRNTVNSAPALPSSDITYTFASGTVVGLTNGWTTTVPTSGGGYLFISTATAASSNATDTIPYTEWASPNLLSQDGAQGNPGSPGSPGSDGIQAASPTVFQWQPTIPAAPSGTSTYTWNTGTFSSIPSGWTTTPGTAPSVGYTLWAAVVNITAYAYSGTTIFNWTSATVSARGSSGTQGPPGPTGSVGQTGASRRLAYTRVTGNSLNSSPSTVTTTGSTSFPPTGSWGETVAWSDSVYTISAGQALFQTDGIYNPATNQTVWGLPYLSSLKVGTLSAITASMGTLNVDGPLTVSGSGLIRVGSANYSGGTFSGTGVVISPSGIAGGSGTEQFSINSSGVATFKGQITGGTINISGNLVVNSTGLSTLFTATLYRNTATNFDAPGLAGLTIRSTGVGPAATVSGTSGGNSINITTGSSNGIVQTGGGPNYLFTVNPSTDGGQDLGTSGSFRWRNIYANNSTITTSDYRTKIDVTNTSLGLEFINSLRPVEYRQKIAENIIIGNEILDPIKDPVTGELIEQEGKPIVEHREGLRFHQGLIAQEVIESLKLFNKENCGIWVLSDKNDENSMQALRYEQLIAPLIKAIQELSAKVDYLESKQSQ